MRRSPVRWPTSCARGHASRKLRLVPHWPAATAGLLAVLLGALAPSLGAESLTPSSVLLIVNQQSDESRRIGQHYAAVHGLGDEQVVRLDVPADDEVARAVYERTLEAPVAAHIARHRLHDRVLVLVVTKGVPLRIAGTRGRDGTVSSVDSELALLYRKMLGTPPPVAGRVANPYFLGDRPLAEARAFRREDHDIYLVTRLDAFTADEAVALVDRGRQARPEGRFVLDLRAALDDPGNRWLEEAGQRLTGMGFGDRVIVERTSQIVTEPRDIVGYYAWGVSDTSRRARTSGLGFAPGAIAGTFAATDGRTFAAPPEGWTLGTWPNRASHYAGSPETLAGDLIREGVTGVSAHVADPFLDGAVRPQVLLPAYASGFSLAEAYYLAMPFLSWQTIVIGDPLVRPFPRREADATAGGPAAEPPAPGQPPAASRQSPADEIDSATELPRLFAARRLATSQAGRLDRRGLELALRGESRLARGDEAGAYEALEQAVAAEPRLFQTQYVLAERDERAQAWARAESRYRAVLELDGNQVVALNNLAYLLAERLARPGDALPLARRAYTLSNGTAVVADTLGWTYYRLGDLAQASRYIAEAVRGAPDLAEVRLHAAAVAVGTGQLDLAARELTRALELDPSLDGHPLTAELRAALAAISR